MNNKAMNIDNSKQFFGILADHWLYDFLANDESISNNTIRLYISTWNKYIKPSEIYHLPLEEISAGTIQRLYNKLSKTGCPNSALHTINKVMSRFYKHLVHQRLAPADFTSTLKVPKLKVEEERHVITWTDDELYTILHSFEKAQKGFRLRFLVVLATYTGLRISELLGVRYENIVKTDKGYVLKVRQQVSNITTYNSDGSKSTRLGLKSLKSRRSYRTIPLNDIVMDELRIHRAWHREEAFRKQYELDFIFTTESGNLYDQHNCDAACKRYYERIGVKYKSFHCYRHTFGTNLHRLGVPIIEAAELMGHKDTSVTEIYYISTSDDKKRSAIEMLAKIV